MRRFVFFLLAATAIVAAGHARATVIRGDFSGPWQNNYGGVDYPGVTGHFLIDTSQGRIPHQSGNSLHYFQLLYPEHDAFFRVWLDIGAGLVEAGGAARSLSISQDEQYDTLRMYISSQPGTGGEKTSLEVVLVRGGLFPEAFSLDEMATAGLVNPPYGLFSRGTPGRGTLYFGVTSLTMSADGTQVPEPDSIWLAASMLGLGAAMLNRRRRLQSQDQGRASSTHHW